MYYNIKNEALKQAKACNCTDMTSITNLFKQNIEIFVNSFIIYSNIYKPYLTYFLLSVVGIKMLKKLKHFNIYLTLNIYKVIVSFQINQNITLYIINSYHLN